MADTANSAPPSYQHTRWNFVIIVLDASFWTAGLAFVDPVAVLPILVSDLGGSRLAVGLVNAIQRAGWLLPQLLASSLVLHRPRKKPFLLYPCLISRLPFVALAITFSLPGAGANARVLLLLLVVVYFIFFFGDGLSGVPWYDIIARSIRPGLRGRFFGSIQFVGGLMAVGAGAVVHRLLADTSIPFPQNYGRLFVFLCVGMALSTVLLALIREPRGAPHSEAYSVARIIRATPSILRTHPLLRRLVPAQILCGLAGLTVPFYAVYAHSELGLPSAVGGLFIWAGTLGAVGASLVYAYLNDRFGSTRVLRGVAWMVVAAPLAAVLVPLAARAWGLEALTGYLYALVFVLNGATWGGMWMGFINYVLEIAPERLRPIFIGLQAVFASPTVLMPILGGWLLRFLRYEFLFALVVVGGIATVIYVYRLPEPRHLEGTAV